MKTALIFAMLTIAASFHAFAQSTSSTLVQIDGGLVEGSMEDGMIIYRGIPFAAPPLGDLRWGAPRPVEPWEGVLQAREFCPACPQPSNIITALFTKDGMSEDCLYLNIWKPEGHTDEKLPVMVWIYGGGFNMGSASQDLTTGEQLARKGVIVVSMGYRLGALGFLAHPGLSNESEHHISGNYGILDQVAALKWVQRNIESFGGDPDCVTIFGQSAGGQSVSILTASPLARGLFHRAICMSGGYFRPASVKKLPEYTQTLEGAEADGLKIAEHLGASTLAELRALDPEAFLDSPLEQLDYWPLIDGYVIKDDLYKLYAEGDYIDIPVLIGNTSDEGTLFTMTSIPGQYVDSVRNNYGPVADKILDLYPAGEEDLNRRSMGALFRDTYFGWPAFTWASLQSKTGKSPVYMYYFDQPQPPSPITMLLKSDGAYHGSDCAYVFGHLDQNPAITYTDEDQRLSERMTAYWVNFARYGDPNGKGNPNGKGDPNGKGNPNGQGDPNGKGDPNGEGVPVWPVYDPEHPAVMILKGDPRAGPLPNLDKLKVLDEYFRWKRTGDPE